MASSRGRVHGCGVMVNRHCVIGGRWRRCMSVIENFGLQRGLVSIRCIRRLGRRVNAQICLVHLDCQMILVLCQRGLGVHSQMKTFLVAP